MGEHAALLTLHHIVSDGWSADVLIAEITELYTVHALEEVPFASSIRRS